MLCQLWKLDEDVPVVRGRDGQIVAWANASLDFSAKYRLATLGAMLSCVAGCLVMAGLFGWASFRAGESGLQEDLHHVLAVGAACVLGWLFWTAWRKFVKTQQWRILYTDDSFRERLVTVAVNGPPWTRRDHADIHGRGDEHLGTLTAGPHWPADWSLEGDAFADLSLVGKTGPQGFSFDGGRLELRRDDRLVAEFTNYGVRLIDPDCGLEQVTLLAIALAARTLDDRVSARDGRPRKLY
jgi:hypothetical protein